MLIPQFQIKKYSRIRDCLNIILSTLPLKPDSLDDNRAMPKTDATINDQVNTVCCSWSIYSKNPIKIPLINVILFLFLKYTVAFITSFLA